MPKWPISLPFYIPQLVKSLPFYIPEAWKRYPFRAEPPRVSHYREYPPGVSHSAVQSSYQFSKHKVTIHCADRLSQVVQWRLRTCTMCHFIRLPLANSHLICHRQKHYRDIFLPKNMTATLYFNLDQKASCITRQLDSPKNTMQQQFISTPSTLPEPVFLGAPAPSLPKGSVLH